MSQQCPISYYDATLIKLLREAVLLLSLEEGNMLIPCEDFQACDRSHLSTIYTMRRNAWLARAGELLGKEGIPYG